MINLNTLAETAALMASEQIGYAAYFEASRYHRKMYTLADHTLMPFSFECWMTAKHGGVTDDMHRAYRNGYNSAHLLLASIQPSNGER